MTRRRRLRLFIFDRPIWCATIGCHGNSFGHGWRGKFCQWASK